MRLAPLAAAAALLLGGAYGYAEAQDVTGIALLAAGLITLGIWLAQEVRRDHTPPDPEQEQHRDRAPRG